MFQAKIVFTVVISIAFCILLNTGECLEDTGSKCEQLSGCYKGHCWTLCNDFCSKNVWCHTTEGIWYDGNKVECTDKNASICESGWNCADDCKRRLQTPRPT